MSNNICLKIKIQTCIGINYMYGTNCHDKYHKSNELVDDECNKVSS